MRYFLALFVSSFLGFAQHAAAQQTYYALKCKPGSNTSFTLSEVGELRFGFTRTSVAAGPNGTTLNPGECAWVDRPVNANEPNFVAAALSQNFKVGAVVPHTFNNSFKAYIYADQEPWVTDFSQKAVILTIYVYNDGSNFLRAYIP
jgi:hypothetical protein